MLHVKKMENMPGAAVSKVKIRLTVTEAMRSFNMKITRIFVYYTIAFLQGLTIVVIPAASTIFKAAEENAISDAEYGLLTLPMIVSAILSTTLLKQILALLGRRKLYFYSILANLGYLLLTAVSYFSKGDSFSSFLLLLGANFMLGLGFGLLVSVLNIYTVALNPQKSDALLTGLHSCLGMGAALSPQLITFAHTWGIWQTASIAIAGVFFTIMLVSIPFVPKEEGVKNKSQLRSDTKGAAKMPLGIWLFLLLITAYALVETIVFYWTSEYLSLEKGLGLEESLKALSIFWLMITVGRVSASLLSLKLDGWYLYLLSPVLIFTAGLLLISATASVVLQVYVILGLGCSYFFPLSLSLAARTYPKYQEKIAGLAVAALMLGVGICNFFVGYLKNNDYLSLNQAFSGVAGIALFLLLGTLFLFFRERKI